MSKFCPRQSNVPHHQQKKENELGKGNQLIHVCLLPRQKALRNWKKITEGRVRRNREERRAFKIAPEDAGTYQLGEPKYKSNAG